MRVHIIIRNREDSGFVLHVIFVLLVNIRGVLRRRVVAQGGEITEGRRVHVALAPIGGASFQRSYACLAPMGRLCMFGASRFAPGTRRSIAAVLAGAATCPELAAVDVVVDGDFIRREISGVDNLDIANKWLTHLSAAEKDDAESDACCLATASIRP